MTPDAARRKAAYDAELAAWESVSVPLAAAMNGIKGEAGVLNRRRGWADSLEPALFTNAVDRTALDAMHAAVVASFPDFRRYLRAKARLLGHRDGAACRGGTCSRRSAIASSASVTWDEASDAVLDAFGDVLARAAPRWPSAPFDERWVDAEARDGKRGGAFCMPVRGDESRVLMNFGGTFDSVSTLAHELGHAYHNTNLADRTPLQRQTPMALAETASIFCETILVQAGLRGRGRRSRPRARAARHRPAPAPTPGRRRHPLAVPVRARASSNGGPSETLSVHELNDADDRRRSSPPTATASTRLRSTRTCGR